MSQKNPNTKHVSSASSSGTIFTKKHASKVHLLPWQVLPSFYADADQSLEPTSNPVQHVPTLLEVCQLIFRIAPRAFDCKINALPSWVDVLQSSVVHAAKVSCYMTFDKYLLGSTTCVQNFLSCSSFLWEHVGHQSTLTQERKRGAQRSQTWHLENVDILQFVVRMLDGAIGEKRYSLPWRRGR